MTRRSFNNERYTVEQETETSSSYAKKSASKAKPAKEAGSTVYVKQNTKKSRKELREEARLQEAKRQARNKKKFGEVSLDVMTTKQQTIKTWRTIWWIALGAAVVLIVLAFLVRNTNMFLFVLTISMSYIALGFALFVEFGKIRKIRDSANYETQNKSRKQIKHEIAEAEAEKAQKEAKKAEGRLNVLKKKVRGEDKSTETDLPFDESSESSEH